METILEGMPDTVLVLKVLYQPPKGLMSYNMEPTTVPLRLVSPLTIA